MIWAATIVAQKHDEWQPCSDQSDANSSDVSGQSCVRAILKRTGLIILGFIELL